MICRILVAHIACCLFTSLAQAHVNKCEHTHRVNGRIQWASDCGDSRTSMESRVSVGTDAEHSSHSTHPQHNMLLLGVSEVFASHIVYKAPHNFQIILKIHLPREALAHYLELRTQDPKGQVVLLLDSMDIGSIRSVATIAGSIQIRGSTNPAQSLRVALTRGEFEVIYFNELPCNT